MFAQMRTELRNCRRYCDMKMLRSIFDKYIFATIDRVYYDETLFGLASAANDPFRSGLLIL